MITNLKKRPPWARWLTIDAYGEVEYWELKPKILETYGIWYRGFSRRCVAGHSITPTDDWTTCIKELKDER